MDEWSLSYRTFPSKCVLLCMFHASNRLCIMSWLLKRHFPDPSLAENETATMASSSRGARHPWDWRRKCITREIEAVYSYLLLQRRRYSCNARGPFAYPSCSWAIHESSQELVRLTFTSIG